MIATARSPLSDDAKREAWAFVRSLVLACAPALCAWGIDAAKEAIARRRARADEPGSPPADAP